jgi:hypothetical protein
MKRNPRLNPVLARMMPGVLSKDGFLGSDPRPLEEILDADRSAVASLGASHQELAQRLREVLEKAQAALGTPVQVGPGLQAVHHEGMGRIPCPFGSAQGRPFGGCGTFPKGEAELTDPATGERVFLTALGVHLIAAHGFYQGKGSRYRLEPAAIARLLGMRAL